MVKGRRKKGVGQKNGSQEPNPLGYRYLMEGPRRERPVPLGDILPTILAKTGATRRLSVERFRSCWDSIRNELLIPAGISAEIDDLDLAGFRGGVLSFDIASAPLAMEIAFFQQEILRRFQHEMPEEKIRKIRFVQK